LDWRLETDGPVTAADLCLETARCLADGGPWGAGFPEPLFHGDVELVSQRVVGESHRKLVVRLDGRLVDAIAFRRPPLDGVQRLRLASGLAASDYGHLPTDQIVEERLFPLQ